MALFKCKMCGGTLEINNETVATCEYCGTTQTLPKTNDNVISNLFNRANNLRLKCEFDKAAQIYEKIVEQDDSEAEAHWGIVLCKYGIEYVEDPKTFKRIPTCHRTVFDSIMKDTDYLAAIDYSDTAQQQIYESEARAIDRIQKDILAIVKNEKPFDVFICYKETDESGKRTVDSVIANDIYYQLTQEGFKVFYAAITLEDKLGQEYEPYIFAALNSAKVMLVLGTKPEYYTAVWVKNEWSRFLQLMKSDRSKLLIPCYRDMDAYDLPEEFAHLQAQDMGKIGFINDVVRGIKKVAYTEAATPTVSPVKETVVVQQPTSLSGNATALLKRGYMALEDGEWTKADGFFEEVLNQNAECAEAYLGKLMAELRVGTQANLKDYAIPFDGSNNYKKAIRFADDKLKAELVAYVEHINARNEEARLSRAYTVAKNLMSAANTEEAYIQAAEAFEAITDYQDSANLAKECYEKADAAKETARKDAILTAGKNKMGSMNTAIVEGALRLFESIPGWKDADICAITCRKKIEEIEADRLERERQAEVDRKKAEIRAKRNKKIAIIATPILCALIAFVILLTTVIIPNNKYNDATELMEAGKYTEAISEFEALDGYKDSSVKISECETAILDGKYNDAVLLIESGKYTEAITAFTALDGYKDSAEMISVCWDKITVRETLSAGNTYTVGVKSDGTVVAKGSNGYGQCDVSEWTDIIAVAAGSDHTLGLKSDGTVVAEGNNWRGQCDVSEWTDIVAISTNMNHITGSNHAVGLKSDGTVVAKGNNSYGQCDVSEWTDIIAVAAGSDHTLGLKSDGTVVATGYNKYGQCDVSDWRDIIAVSAGIDYTVGLKSDGTVVAVGYNWSGQCDTSRWRDIIAISAGGNHTVGLKSDGTVVAVGQNRSGQCYVFVWTDIVAISAGGNHTVGLKSDGTLVAVGGNISKQCDVSDWKGIKLP